MGEKLTGGNTGMETSGGKVPVTVLVVANLLENLTVSYIMESNNVINSKLIFVRKSLIFFSVKLLKIGIYFSYRWQVIDATFCITLNLLSPAIKPPAFF